MESEGGGRLVVGLGNPGPRYHGTRHNIGFAVVDGLGGPAATWHRVGAALVAEARVGEHDVGLVKPQEFMNRSGRAVVEVAVPASLSPAAILVVHDELDLPLGVVRLKRGGGTAGHRGIASVAEHLGTDAFPRLRFGIGRPPAGIDVAEFVLGRFSSEEAAGVTVSLAKAIEATRDWVLSGIDAAMGRVNVRSALSLP